MALPKSARVNRTVKPQLLAAILADLITAIEYLDTNAGPDGAVVPHEVMKRLEKFQLEMVFQGETQASLPGVTTQHHTEDQE